MLLHHKISQNKIKFTLENITLTDVPTRQNRIFLKVKYGSHHFTTKPVQIKDNSAIFNQEVSLEIPSIHIPKKPKHYKPFRLSFRLENSSGSGFTRYGVIELNIFERIMSQNLNVECGLDNCEEKPIFRCHILIPSNLSLAENDTNTSFNSESENSMQSNSSTTIGSSTTHYSHHRVMSASNSFSLFNKSNEFDLSESTKTESIKKSHNLPNIPRPFNKNSKGKGMSNSLSASNLQDLQQTSVSSPDLTATKSISSPHITVPDSYENAPINIPLERYTQLESQIDNLLTDIILNTEN